MIIQCDKCATRYRLDESRVTGAGVKVRCTKCQNVFMVAPPIEDAHIEEVLSPEKGKSPAPLRPSIKKEEKPARDLPKERPAGRKVLDNETLKFNFERPPEESPVDTAGIKDERSPAPDSPFPDFGFKAAEKEEPSAKPEMPPSGRKSHFEDLDFSFGDDDGAKGAGPSTEEPGRGPDEWNIGPGKETANKEIKAGEKPAEPPKIEPPAPPPAAPPVKDPQEVKPQVAGYTKGGLPAGKFEDILSASISDGDSELDDEEVPAAPPPGRRRLGVKYYVIAGAIALIAAAAFYFTGGADMVTGKFLSSASAPRREEPVRIDTVRGYFVDNRNIGRVFVIEAWVKNISDSPQDIREIRGVLYNNSGEKIKVQSVSPGRVISIEDIKNLSKDDILKQYKDVSGGTVPPKGAVPVTIVFTDIPKGMAEYGVEIVRRRS